MGEEEALTGRVPSLFSSLVCTEQTGPEHPTCSAPAPRQIAFPPTDKCDCQLPRRSVLPLRPLPQGCGDGLFEETLLELQNGDIAVLLLYPGLSQHHWSQTWFGPCHSLFRLKEHTECLSFKLCSAPRGAGGASFVQHMEAAGEAENGLSVFPAKQKALFLAGCLGPVSWGQRSPSEASWRPDAMAATWFPEPCLFPVHPGQQL
ncbi:hypothetical protein H8958_012904, partial [Nasalis larvatus]